MTAVPKSEFIAEYKGECVVNIIKRSKAIARILRENANIFDPEHFLFADILTKSLGYGACGRCPRII